MATCWKMRRSNWVIRSKGFWTLNLSLQRNWNLIKLWSFLKVRSLSTLTHSFYRTDWARKCRAGKHLARRFGGNPENSNSAIEQFTYIGDLHDDLLRAKLSVFGQIVSEPLFDILRAREQLGYIVCSHFCLSSLFSFERRADEVLVASIQVSSGPRKSIAFMGLRVIVQSEKDASYVEGRVDAFWEEFMGTLEKMSEEEFDKYKEAVRAKKVEDHKNLWQESVCFSLSLFSSYFFIHWLLPCF